MKNCTRSMYYLSALLLLGTMLIGCSGRQQSIREEAPAQSAVEAKKLEKKYSRVLLKEFDVPAQIASDYPEAALLCKVSAVSKLGQKKLFEEVGLASEDKSYGQSTLLVKTRIEEMRLVSGAARMWAGAFAGSSNMVLDVELVDGGTGKVVGKQQLASANNAFAAAWVGGMSDVSLPSDMGAILAEYIASVTPR